jgi:hypothetical protein
MHSVWHRFKEAPLGCLFFFLSQIPLLANAQSVEELDPLEFGIFAIPSNSGVSEVELPRSGRNIGVTGSIVVISAGFPGRYLLSELPANTPIDISANDTELRYAGAGGSEVLRISQYDAASVVTNNQGETEIQLGGLLKTTGNGNFYEDGPYTGSTQLLLTYWESEIGEYVTRGFNIEINSQVRTSFSLEESAALNFGTVFARATAEDQAEFRLAADGKFSLVNRGDARFVSLSKPQPAVLLVSGAAPDRELAIELPDSDIILRNTEEPSGPHFILSQFVSAPVGTGRTDEDGILEILLGGTLSTQLTSNDVVYPAGIYEATYDITVSY